MEQDIVIIGARHFTSKKTGEVFGVIDYCLVDKTTEQGATGYSVINAFVEPSLAMSIPGAGIYKGTYGLQIRAGKQEMKLIGVKLIQTISFEVPAK